MEWYWWFLIVVAVIIIGYIKLKVWKMILDRKKKSEREDDY